MNISFPEEKGQGKDVSGLPGYCLLIIRTDESKHAASDCAPPLGGREQRNAVPSQ